MNEAVKSTLKETEMNFNESHMIDFNSWKLKLKSGSHSNPKEGSCLMETVAYISGADVYTDHPECACPVITDFAISTNDWMNDVERQRLLPFVLRIAGSKASQEIQEKRGYMCADYAVRVFAPLWVEFHNASDAAKMRELPKIVDKASALQAEKVCLEVKNAAAAYAAYAANAAYAAYANAAAYAYANAAAYAANASKIRAQIVEARIQLIDDMLKLTDDVQPVFKRKVENLVELQA